MQSAKKKTNSHLFEFYSLIGRGTSGLLPQVDFELILQLRIIENSDFAPEK
jgi:MFS-type transporter involved in bile tolerance (Atg22 family)